MFVHYECLICFLSQITVVTYLTYLYMHCIRGGDLITPPELSGHHSVLARLSAAFLSYNAHCTTQKPL